MKAVILLFLLLPIFSVADPGRNAKQSATASVSGKISFSSSPFTGTATNSKTSFTSGDFIYGRLELSGMSIKDAFKLKESTRPSYLVCEVEVLQDGEPVGYHTYRNNYIFLEKGSLDKTSLNFDVLPDPNQASTLYSMTDDFTAGYGYTPLYNMINPNFFPSGGNYHLNVKIYSRTYDAYDQQEDQEKWPFIQDGFDFTLRESDIATLKKNGKASWDFMAENAFRLDKMPAVFSNPGKLTDPNATTAKVAAILKRDLPQRAIIKFVAEPYSGTQWHIAKDDYGLPRYKYFNPHIWMAYKSGGKCFVGFVTLRQVYSGGGTYGPLEVAWTSTKDDRVIDCVKVK